MIWESLGWTAGALAVMGVLGNNRRRRWCFLVWFVSNGLSAAIHAHAGIWALCLRDAVFLVLAVEGYLLWGRNSAHNTGRDRRSSPGFAAWSETQDAIASGGCGDTATPSCRRLRR
jgi:nicotinamide riboside transporter PnuC